MKLAAGTIETAGGTVLRGRSLRLAQLLWLVAVTFTLLMLAASLWAVGQERLFGGGRYALQAAGHDAAMLRMFAGNPFLSTPITWLVTTLQMAAFVLVGLLLFWRKRDDWMVIYASIMLIATGVGFSPGLIILPFIRPAWFVPVTLLQALVFGSLICFWTIFPSGRFVPRWSRFAALAWAIYTLSWLFFPALNPHQGQTALGLVIFVLASWAGIAAQVYRYRTDANAVERQQMKWVMAGFFSTAVAFGLLVCLFALGVDVHARQNLLLNVLSVAIGLTGTLIPLSIAVALSRTHLWQIDLIIRKTLQYGLLTAVLAGLYFAAVLLAQSAFVALTGEESALAIVLSTLLIAALFNPLRRRLQSFIDRRFYRSQFDRQQVLTRFAQVARDEVALDQLTAELSRVIWQTLQPDRQAIWLQAPSDLQGPQQGKGRDA